MCNPENNEHLEIYKLFVDLTDRANQRCEGVNRLFVSLYGGLVILITALIRFDFEDIDIPLIFYVVGIISLGLSVCWYFVIRSYRDLITDKFLALHELEEKLKYPFFVKRWGLSTEDKYKKLSREQKFIDVSLPILFFLLTSFLLSYPCWI